MNTASKCIAASLLLTLATCVGCGYKSQVENLQTEVAGLEEDNQAFCAFTIELTSEVDDGYVMYVGDGIFVDMQGQVYDVSGEMSEMCEEVLDSFGQVIVRRETLRAYADRVLAAEASVSQ